MANQVEEPAGHSTHDVTLLHNDGNTLSWANHMEEVKSKAVEEINPAKLNEKLLVKVKRLDNEAELDVLDKALQDGINHQDERKQIKALMIENGNLKEDFACEGKAKREALKTVLSKVMGIQGEVKEY